MHYTRRTILQLRVMSVAWMALHCKRRHMSPRIRVFRGWVDAILVSIICSDLRTVVRGIGLGREELRISDQVLRKTKRRSHPLVGRDRLPDLIKHVTTGSILRTQEVQHDRGLKPCYSQSHLIVKTVSKSSSSRYGTVITCSSGAHNFKVNFCYERSSQCHNDYAGRTR